MVTAAKKRATQKSTSAQRTYLVGDVGGTRTRLALYSSKGRAPLAEAVHPSREHATFDEIAERFLAGVDVPPPRGRGHRRGRAGARCGRRPSPTSRGRSTSARSSGACASPACSSPNDLVVGARGCLEVGAADMELLTAHAAREEGAAPRRARRRHRPRRGAPGLDGRPLPPARHRGRPLRLRAALAARGRAVELPRKPASPTT